MFETARGLGAACILGVFATFVAACGGSGGDRPRSLPALPATSVVGNASAPATSPADLGAAADVVRRYFALLNAPTTVETADALAALMTPSCGCRRVVRSMRDLAARGEHYYGSNRLIAAIPNRDSSTLVDVVVDYDYSDSGIQDRTGRALNVEHGRRGVKVDIRLTKSASRWLIDRIDILSEGK